MLKIIAAVADNGVIGNVEGLPWHLPDDMRWFQRQTGSDPVLMGRKTFNSLPQRFRPLPGRQNIILSRYEWNSEGWPGADVVVTNDWDSILERAKQEDIWVIGGAEVYKLALPHAFELYLTRVHGSPEGDTFFPNWDPSEWTLGWEYHRDFDEKHAYARTWQVFFRDTPIYQFANTRTHEQRQVMFESLERDECPFCPEGLGVTHVSPVLWSGKHWYITGNDYQYKDSKGNLAKKHLLLIPLHHLETLAEISPKAWEEFASVLLLLDVKGGGLACRFGNPILSGSSIKHLHFHIISPELGGIISFPIGCYKTSVISPPEI